MRIRKAAEKERQKLRQELGAREFTCPSCGHTWTMDWLDLFDLQEMTHGFVGYECSAEDFTSCPKCDRVLNDQTDDSPDPT